MFAVAEFGAGFVGEEFNLVDDFGVLAGEIVGFAGVCGEVVEGFFDGCVLVAGGDAVCTTGLAIEGAVGVWEMQFPVAAADGVEVRSPIEVESIVGGCLVFFGHKGCDAETVDGE